MTLGPRASDGTFWARTLHGPGWIVAVALALCAAVGMVGNGAQRPLESHEVLVARTAVEMQRSGNWLVPLFNDAPRLQKPPLAYWCAIFAHQLIGSGDTGVSEFEARMPAALAGAALVLVTFALARHAFGSTRAAVAAAALWATSHGCFKYSHNAKPEMLYTLFCALAMLFFVRQARRVGRPPLNALGAWSSVILALLAKGPFLPLFTIAGAALAVRLQRRLDPAAPSVRAVLWPWSGLAFVLAVAGCYFAYVALRVPGAVEFWNSQMFDRTGGASAAWWQPLKLIYVRATLELLAPWWMLVPLAAVLAWRSRDLCVRMLAFALAASIVCLSFSQGSKSYYAMPAMPLGCALLGGAAEQLLSRWRGTRKLAVALRSHAILAAAGAAAVGVLVLAVPGSTTAAERALACVAVLGALIATLASWRSARERHGRSFLALCSALVLILAAASLTRLGWGEERFNDGAFARAVASVAPRGRPLARTYGPLELFVYYGDRHVEMLQEGGIASWSAAHPDGLLIVSRAELQRGLVAGRVLLSQPAHEDEPMVLVELDGG